MIEFQGMTRQQWEDFLNQLSYVEVLGWLIDRIVKDPVYSINRNIKGDAYDKLVMENKPTRAQFEEEWNNYRPIKQAEINAIFDDLELEADIKARLIPIIEISQWIFRELGQAPNNEDAFFKRIVQERDIAKLKQMEAVLSAAQAAKSDHEQRESQQAQLIASFKDDFASFLRSVNINQLSPEQAIEAIKLLLKEARYRYHDEIR